jgi:hypothetical protein
MPAKKTTVVTSRTIKARLSDTDVPPLSVEMGFRVLFEP